MGNPDLISISYVWTPNVKAELSHDFPRLQTDRIKGQVRLGETARFVPYYPDLGTGDSELTWQALLGIGYRLDCCSANLALRSLSYELDDSDSNMRFTGPALGVSFFGTGNRHDTEYPPR